jgi:hypothetical protein
MGWSNVEPQRSQATSGRLLSNRLDGRLGVRLPVSCEKIASGLAESYWNPANEGEAVWSREGLRAPNVRGPMPPVRAGSIPLELIFNNVPPVVDGFASS